MSRPSSCETLTSKHQSHFTVPKELWSWKNTFQISDPWLSLESIIIRMLFFSSFGSQISDSRRGGPVSHVLFETPFVWNVPLQETSCASGLAVVSGSNPRVSANFTWGKRKQAQFSDSLTRVFRHNAKTLVLCSWMCFPIRLIFDRLESLSRQTTVGSPSETGLSRFTVHRCSVASCASCVC